MGHKLHTPTDEEFLERIALIPQEVNLTALLKAHQQRQDDRQVFTLENKDVRVEIYLKS